VPEKNQPVRLRETLAIFIAVLKWEARDVTLLDALSTYRRAQRLFPLPGGEGQGEGERETK
jgi:hypothetical protein